MQSSQQDFDKSDTLRQLENSQEQLQSILNHSSAIIYFKDLQGRHLQVNPEYERLTGYKKEAVIGKTDYELFSAEVAEQFCKNDCHVLKVEKSTTFEEILTLPNGIKTYISVKFPLYNQQGKLYGVGGISTDITARKQVEIALRQSEQRFANLAAIAPVGIFRTNVEGNCIYVNEYLADLAGLTPKSFVEQSWLNFVHPEDRNRVANLWQKTVQNQDNFTSEFRLQRLDRSSRFILSQAIPERSLQGEIIGYVGTAIDISDRKQTEMILQFMNSALEQRVHQRTTELEERNRQLQREITIREQAEIDLQQRIQEVSDLYNNAPCGYHSLNAEGDIVDINETELKWLGYSREEIVDRKNFADLLTPEQRLVFKENLSKLKQQGEVNNLEYDLTCKDSTILPVSLSAISVKDANGNFLKSRSSLINISEQRQAEKFRQEIETRFRNAFNYAAIGMAILGLDHRWIKVNSSLCDIVGYSAKELASMTFQDITHSHDLKTDLNLLQQILKGDIPYYHLEKRYIHKQGKEVWIFLSCSLVRNANNEPLYFLAQIQDITERKQMELRLQEQKQQFEAVFHQSFEFIGLLSPNGTVIQANQTALDFVGVTQENVINRPFWETEWWTISEDVQNQLKQAIAKAAQGEFIRYEVNIFGKNKTTATIDFSIKPVFNEKGEVILLIPEGRDITDRKTVEAERSKLIAIIEASLDIIATTKTNSQVKYLNQAARNFFGCQENECLEDFYLTEHQPNWAAELVTERGIPFAKKQGTWIGETAFINKQGEEVPISQMIIAHKSSEGKVKRFSTIARDITQQKKIESVLREANRRWQSLINNVQLLVVGLNNFGKIDYINPFFLKVTGYAESDILEQDWLKFFIPPHNEYTMQTILEKLVANNGHFHCESSLLTQSGEKRAIAWNLTLLKDANENIIGIISIGEDITERQAVERLKSEFISIVSHELRTPLTGIHGSLGLLATGVYDNKPEKAQRMINIALQDSERLVRLVNDILSLERLESGQVTPEKQACSVSELIQQSIQAMQGLAEQHSITLSAHSIEAQVWADPDTILQTFTNLISNAIKFSPPNSTISLSAENIVDLPPELETSQPQQPYSYILFAVKDSGQGIPKEKLETIFGRFKQVNISDSRQKGGTGLGLAICKTIIEQHQGYIWATSKLGEGSTFYFTLPIANLSTYSI